MTRPPARGTADRELRAEVRIDATPDEVWAALTDFEKLAERSPELVRMVPLKRGGLREGQWYLGVNRRKAVVWPTRNVVKTVEPGRTLVWHTATSGATWINELEAVDGGTRLVQRRPVPRLTFLSRITAGTVLGGGAQHADELEDGMATTLARLKAEIEKG
ncbi:SRPBCC family protein [Nocardioides sp.]|uniref:SRPBCC family protein n=1 Tax=Nocardioides sp. TaxID=35761 RepID=UPI002C094A27|nr:SRPBCC family protein [Nocardioides sp.]HSX67484.1 SRPBCC family protein [Nocardioides sp.]